MDSENYFQEMRKVSEIVNPIIYESIEPLKKTSKSLYDIVSELPIKRIEEPSKTRAFVLREAYNLTNGEEWEKIAPVCAAVEMELCSMYYENRIYDDKGHITEDKNKINNQIMAARITRDLSTRIIEDLKGKIPDKKLEQILHLMNESDLIFESGEYLDVFENVYPEMKDASFEDMIKCCNKRLYMINASYYEKIAIIGAILGNGTKEQIKALAEFGKNYGMLLQITNDIADFTPAKHGLGTSEKIPEDAYSDIKHGKLTYPIIYALHYGTGEERARLVEIIKQGKKVDETELIELTKILVNNGSIDFARKSARKHYNKAKQPLKIFDKEKRKYLSAMSIMGISNRYYKILNQYREN